MDFLGQRDFAPMRIENDYVCRTWNPRESFFSIVFTVFNHILRLHRRHFSKLTNSVSPLYTLFFPFALNHYKNKHNVLLIYKIQSYWLFLYRQKESFQLHGQIGLWQIIQLSIFVLSHEKCHYQSRWESNFRFFFIFLGFLFPPPPRKFLSL